MLAAYLLLPVVDRAERGLRWVWPRGGWHRLAAILIIYVVALVLLVEGMVTLISPISVQITGLLDKAPGYIEGARTTAEEWGQRYRAVAPPAVQEEVDRMVADAAKGLRDTAQTAAPRIFQMVTQTFGVIVGFFVVPVWIFYVLRDQRKAIDTYYRIVPDFLRRDAEAVAGIVNNTMGRYLRAQLLLGVFVGALAGVGLWLLGVDYSLPLGIFAGVFELIPFIGPVLGAVPALVVAVASDPSKVPWVIVLFVGVQLVENNLLVPQLQGAAVRLNPAMIMLVLVLAGELAGLGGMLVAVPLVAVGRDLFVYVYQRLGEEAAMAEAPQIASDGGDDTIGVSKSD